MKKVKIKVKDIIDEFSSLFTQNLGDLNLTIEKRTTPAHGKQGTIVFVDNESACKEVLLAQPTAVVTNPKYLTRINELKEPKSILVTANVPLAMAQITKKFFWESPFKAFQNEEIHPSSIIALSASIGKNVIIGPNVFIDENVIVEDGAFIGAQCVLQSKSYIGKNSVLQPLSFIGYECHLGTECVVQSNTSIGTEGYGFATDQNGHHHRIPQTGIVFIEDRVEIGSCCAIDRGAIEETRIGEGTKIDNLCHIAHNVKIGKNSFITAGFVIAGSTVIGDNFACGGHVSINGHITITDNVRLAGRSVVHHSIKESGAYGGHPLQKIQDYLKTIASLEHLTEMRKDSFKIKSKI